SVGHSSGGRRSRPGRSRLWPSRFVVGGGTVRSLIRSFLSLVTRPALPPGRSFAFDVISCGDSAGGPLELLGAPVKQRSVGNVAGGRTGSRRRSGITRRRPRTRR